VNNHLCVDQVVLGEDDLVTDFLEGRKPMLKFSELTLVILKEGVCRYINGQ